MKVTQNDIINFNEIYQKCKNYSEVARQTGFSASTVRKYVQKDYTPQDQRVYVTFKIEDIPADIDMEPFIKKDWGELCALTYEEMAQLDELRKEILI